MKGSGLKCMRQQAGISMDEQFFSQSLAGTSKHNGRNRETQGMTPQKLNYKTN